MSRAIIRTVVLMFTCGLIHAQTVEKPLTFDAASVKPAAPPAGRGFNMMTPPSGGPGSKDPGRIHYPNMPMKSLLMTAYDVKDFQIVGPEWLNTERFDIDATMAPDATREQFRAMLQNLLAERFKLTVHRETKDLPMYSLLVAKGGLKIKESAEVPAPPKDDADAPSPPPLPSQPKIGPDGFPILPQLAGRAGIFNIMMNGRSRMIAQKQTMLDLANRLTALLSRPVTDATGLKPKYDFILTFSQEGMNGPMGPAPPPPPPAGGGLNGAPSASATEAETLPDIFGALQSQLGLRLEPKKGPVGLIVVDHVEKSPTEN
jgi:uncharacterized protein (TIGR03435 family)